MRLRSVFSILLSIVALPAFPAITGTVINTEGQAVSGAKIALFAPETADARRVRLQSKAPARVPLAAATSDSKGNYAIDSPKEPVLDLQIDAPGYAPEGMRVNADEELGATALTAAAMQKGTITTAGKPVAGALVVLIAGGGELVATTDANGRYSVPDISKWANRLIVIHPDFAIVDESFGGPFGSTKKGLDRSLDAGVTIKGRVVGADGTTAVPSAPVFVDNWQQATTADDGTFTVAHAMKDWSFVEARIDTRNGARAHASGDVTIKLAKAAAVTGVVTDARTGMPLPGVEVRLFQGQGLGNAALSSRSGFTNAKGAYTLSPVMPGSYQMNLTRPSYAAPNLSVTVAAGQTVQKTVAANPRGRVLGSVMDDEKRPVAAARVSSRPATREQPMMMMGGGRNAPAATAYSGPDGRFVLRSVAVEEDVIVDALKKGYPSGRSPSLRLAPAERKAGVVITIPRGIALTGKVTDGDGRPLSGVSVETIEATNDGGGFGGMRRMVVNLMQGERNDEFVRTSSDGTFNIRVKEGTYDVVFKREGFAAKTVRGESVHAGAKPLTVTLDPGVEITGRVTRAGIGVSGVNVNAVGSDTMASAVTGPDGAFRLEDLTPGQLMVNAMKREEFIQQVRPVTAPAQNVAFEVPAGGRISGRVVDKASHNPVPAFQAGISMSRSGGGMVMQTPPMLKSFTNDDGTFALENIPPGNVQVVVSAPGYTTARMPGVNVEDGKAVTDLEVALDTGARLTGHVTGPDGSPLAGVSVRPDSPTGNRMMRAFGDDSATITDASGDYTIEALEAGERTITFGRQGYLSESRTITLASGAARLDVQLGTGTRLSGTVVSENGSPVADAIVHASSASSSGFGPQEARTDANGGFEIDGLAPGHYMLTAIKSGYANGVLRDFDAAAGAPARIIMQSGGVVMGHVTGLSAQELQSATVMVQSAGGSTSAPVDSSGNYRVEGAPSGTVRVSARAGQMFGAAKTSPVKSVELATGGSVQVDLEFKSTTVRGHVSRDGQPLTNASVAFFPRGAQASTNARSVTDANGNYEVSGLDDATYTVQIMDFQRTSPFSTTYEVRGSGTFDVDIRSTSLRGRVVDASTGAPLADARVELHSTGTDAIFSTRTVPTDMAGNFVIDAVARGTYEAKADKDGYGHDARTIVVGDTAEALEFKLSPSGGVTLNVVDARDNRALAARVVRITDTQGNVVDATPSFGGMGPEPVKLTLAAGMYRVTVSAMGYAPQTVSVPSPSTQTVRMSPGGTVVIRSRSNGTTRARLVDASGMAYVRGGFGGGGGIFIIDASPGVTTLQNIAAGSFRLEILGAGDQVVDSIPVNVVDGQQTPVEVK